MTTHFLITCTYHLTCFHQFHFIENLNTHQFILMAMQTIQRCKIFDCKRCQRFQFIFMGWLILDCESVFYYCVFDFFHRHILSLAHQSIAKIRNPLILMFDITYVKYFVEFKSAKHLGQLNNLCSHLSPCFSIFIPTCRTMQRFLQFDM